MFYPLWLAKTWRVFVCRSSLQFAILDTVLSVYKNVQSPVFAAVCLSQSCAGYIAEAGASALSSLSPPVLVLCCSSAAKVYSDKSP